MNWFSCAPLATLEMSSSLYEVGFMDLCHEGAHRKTTHDHAVSCRPAWQTTAASLTVTRLLVFLYIFI